MQRIIREPHVFPAAGHFVGAMDGIEFLLDKLGDTKTNDEFFQRMNS